ncbi:uncharacterized protein LOC119176401 [Rhipicephalus microplus]|uniref:uncharacterized protein LOC119176401 n=1 Tax=Rhipicephalus microplus TaxID=6941 RepID=UPI003F6CA197
MIMGSAPLQKAVLSTTVPTKTVRKKNTLLVIIGTVGVASLFFFYSRQDESFWLKPVIVAKELVGMAQPGYAIYTSGCKIPAFDPFHWTVAGLYRKQTLYVCPGKPSFIRLAANVPSIDARVLWEHHKYKPRDVLCTYQKITRDENRTEPDSAVVYHPSSKLNFGTPLSSDFVFVTCSSNGAKFHEEFLMVPVLKEQVEQRCELVKDAAIPPLNRTKERLNVVIVGLDSVSRLNSLRHLKRTREFLLEQMEAIELYGYNKVGDNSFPNQVPLLTGRSGEEAMSLCPEKFFDNLEFIWDKYASLGYRTLFLEESPKYGLFNYLLKGFKDIPTDYYCRPMIFAIDNSRFKKFIGGGKGCVGSTVQTNMYLDYTTSLVSFLGNRSYFTYTWISDVTHDNFNSAGFADEPFLRAFQRLNASGVMDKSIVVFLSDHGMRYGPIRQTLIGKYEDRMPFVFLMLPREFRRKYPQVVKNLKINQRRLTTHYDLHAMLLELADFPNDFSSFKTQHGTSLLREVPENRTCRDASIAPHWCCCHDSGEFPVTDPLSKKMANFVLETVNGWLHQGAPGKCVRLQLRSVVDVYEVTVDANSDTRYFWVTLKCFPGEGLLEATVAVNGTGALATERVSRLNWHGGQSSCVNNHLLELYCFCKHQ